MATFRAGPPQPSALGEASPGFFEDIMNGLRSIPHLPDALGRGINEPGISDEVRELRRRSISEAAQWVIPLAIGGGAGLVAKGAGLTMKPLIGAIIDAAGLGLGSGIAAKVNEEPVLPAAAMGALLGGGIGAGLGVMSQGAKTAAKGAAEAAEKAAIEAAEATAKRVETEAAEAAAAKIKPFEALPEAQGKVVLGEQGFELSNKPFVPGKELPSPALTKIEQSGELWTQAETSATLSMIRGKMPKSVIDGKPVPRTGEGRYTLPANHQLDLFGPKELTPGQTELFGLFEPELAKKLGQELATKELNQQMIALDIAGIAPVTERVSKRVVSGRARPRAKRVANQPPPLPTTYAPDQVIENLGVQVKDGLLKKLPDGTPKLLLEQAATILHRAFAPSRALLQRMGPAGTGLASLLDETFDAWRKTAGGEIGDVRKILEPWAGKKGLADRVHIGEIMEGLAAPKSDAHREAAEKLADLYSVFATEANELGFRELTGSGRVKNFTPRRDYLTHYYDQKYLDKVVKEGTKERKAVEMMLRERGIAEKNIPRTVRLMLKHPAEFRTGPINMERSAALGAGYEKDPLTVMSRYIYDVRKRLEVARRFGGDYRGIRQWKAAIMKEGGDAKIADKIFAAFNDALPSDYPELLRALGTFNVVTMLSTSGLVQPAQLLNIAAQVGYGNLLKGLGAWTTKAGREWADRSGAHLNEVLQDLTGINDTTGLATIWLKYVTMLEPLDKANRIVASLSGRFYAEELARKFAAKQSPKIAKKFLEIGIDPTQVVGQGFKLTAQQVRDAGYRVSMDTQFASGILDLPELRNSFGGKLAYQFKSFALQQAGFLDKKIVRPARQGDFAPLARYAAGMGPVGGAIGELVRGIKGRAAPESEHMKLIENYAMVGAFGPFYDVLTAMGRGPGAFTSFFLGPTGGELAQFLAGDIPAVIRGNPEALAKHVLRKTPLIGQPLVNYWLDPK